MGRPLKIQQYSLGSGDNATGTGQPVVVDSAYPNFGSLTDAVYPATYTTDQYFGVVGGSNTVSGQAASLTGGNYPTVQVRVYITGGSEDNGFIITQKGATKYLVAAVTPINATAMTAGYTYRILTTGTTPWYASGAPSQVVIGDVFYCTAVGTGTGTVQLVGVCQLSNEADSSLSAGNMTISMDIGDSSVTRISKLTNKYALDWTGGDTYNASAVLQRIRYLANFFDQGETAIKSGTTGAANATGQQNLLTLAQVEDWDA
jgi:hypothetical protein